MAPPNVRLDTVGPFSATISWSGSGPVVAGYEVNWQRDTSGECGDEHQDNTTTSGSDNSYDIMNLFGDSVYSVTVTANNSAGMATSTALPISTNEAGTHTSPRLVIVLMKCCCSLSHQFPLPHLPPSPPPMLFQRVSLFSGVWCHAFTRMETSQATQCSMEYWTVGAWKLR